MMSSTHWSSPNTYSWKILGDGDAAMVSSSDGSVAVLTQCMTPNSVAALVTATAPSGSKTCKEPIGARMAGGGRFLPQKGEGGAAWGARAPEGGVETALWEGGGVGGAGALWSPA